MAGAAWSRGEAAALLVFSLLTFLLIAAYERAFAMIFVLNFSTEGPNSTVLLVLLLLTGLLYVAGLQRSWPHSRKLIDGFVATSAAFSLVSLTPWPAVAALGALAFHTFATPVWLTLLGILRERAAVPAALGILLHQALREVLDTAPYYSSTRGTLLFAVLVVGFVAAWWIMLRPVLDPPLRTPRPIVFLAFLVGEYVFLGSPAALSTWWPVDHRLVVVASAAGLLTGIVLLESGRLPTRWVRHAPLVAALVLVLLFGSLVGGVGKILLVFLAQAGTILALHHGLSVPTHLPLRSTGLRLTAFQLGVVVLVFLLVVAGNWAFVAGVGPLLRGRAELLLEALVLLLPLTILAVTPKKETTRA